MKSTVMSMRALRPQQEPRDGIRLLCCVLMGTFKDSLARDTKSSLFAK